MSERRKRRENVITALLIAGMCIIVAGTIIFAAKYLKDSGSQVSVTSSTDVTLYLDSVQSEITALGSTAGTPESTTESTTGSTTESTTGSTTASSSESTSESTSASSAESKAETPTGTPAVTAAPSPAASDEQETSSEEYPLYVHLLSFPSG